MPKCETMRSGMRSSAPIILLLSFFFRWLLLSEAFCADEYITANSFASYYVDTPDPRLTPPPLGQLLIVSWQIPSALWHQQPLQLDIAIRFRDNSIWHQIIAMDRPVGTYLYEMNAEEFRKSGGILTYKVLLLEEGVVERDLVPSALAGEDFTNSNLIVALFPTLIIQPKKCETNLCTRCKPLCSQFDCMDPQAAEAALNIFIAFPTVGTPTHSRRGFKMQA